MIVMIEYSIPQEHYFRIHHVRPRFKGDIENVLIFMATEIAGINDRYPKEEFDHLLNRAIRNYPGNSQLSEKTINNWRTEISSLFGFIQKDDKFCWPGRRAIELAEKEDLIQAFKIFLYDFQYPGAHVKIQYISELVSNGVHFKPAQYILNVLKYANNGINSFIGISKAEACHCIFNDLRVTRDNEGAEKTWNRIKNNRDSNLQYDLTGDVIRYAGDIIDYMEIANLLFQKIDGKYYLNTKEKDCIEYFCQSTSWFDEYDDLIFKRSADLDVIRKASNLWFAYVNRNIEGSVFSTNIQHLLDDPHQDGDSKGKTFRLNPNNFDFTNTKQIGDFGEALIHEHECLKVKAGGREDLVHLIKIIPTQFAVGYDILSVELNATKRYIEVKTTISTNPISFNRFHLTTNEWVTASGMEDRYFVYRLFISKKDARLVLIQNPVRLYKNDLIDMVPTNGADITFDPSKVGQNEELLNWVN